MGTFRASFMHYLLTGIAGIWLVDGLSLLIAPRFVVTQVREILALSPKLIQWEGLSMVLGMILLLGTVDLPYATLWITLGCAMIGKGLFFTMSSEYFRDHVVEWCLQRKEIDYRFWGLGLCTLALLLLDALRWISPGD